MPQPAQEELNRFGKIIVQWSKEHPRPLAWKNFSDPYHIWIAEIILQQTRVEQGTPYFKKFIQSFPDLRSLAQASTEEVLLLWEGLGYYSRARNLHAAARYVYYDLDGRFPDNSADLQSMKGVGPYTAAAIASFAYGEAIGVVDGNVKRVVSRYFNISEDVKLPATHRRIQNLVNKVVANRSSAEFNQAIMNFGALQCIPGQPDCQSCGANKHCKAYLLEKVDQLPFKSKARKKPERWLYFGVYIRDGKIAMVQNQRSNIWKNLFLFPMVDGDNSFKSSVETTRQKPRPRLPLLGSEKWILSHRRLNIYFYRLDDWPSEWEENREINMVPVENLDRMAIPRPLRLFLQKNSRILS